jgi:hydrogenase maturation protease
VTALHRVVVAGIGNTLRRDDGAGPAVVERLGQLLSNPRTRAPQISGEHEVICAGPFGDPLDLLGDWDGADLALVVDAVHSGAPPGTVTLTWVDRPDEAGQPPSTHGLSVLDAYRLASALDQAPARLAILGIEGEDFGHGEGLSQAVEVAVAAAIEVALEVVPQPYPSPAEAATQCSQRRDGPLTAKVRTPPHTSSR